MNKKELYPERASDKMYKPHKLVIKSQREPNKPRNQRKEPNFRILTAFLYKKNTHKIDKHILEIICLQRLQRYILG